MKNNHLKVFNAYKTNSVGVWFFASNEEWHKGKPCHGFGSIKYPEGSIYTGDIYYDGKNFEKLGMGQQDFRLSNIGYPIIGLNEKKYKYVGKYDYRKNDWIYGNGIMYYTDLDGKPSHFVKGFFSALNKIGDWRGKFDPSVIIDGYTPDMESDFDENEIRLKHIVQEVLDSNNGNVKALLIGDSYFELYKTGEYAGKYVFDETFSKDVVNIGICGSTFADWLRYFPHIVDLPEPDKIIINLGFNDVHNVNCNNNTVRKVYLDYLRFLRNLRSVYPNSKIYLIEAVQAPAFPTFYDKELRWNNLICSTASKCNVTVISYSEQLKKSEKNCFHSDLVHLNEDGYNYFTALLQSTLLN